MSILAIDYGKKKIGVAFSDESERIALIDKDIRILNDEALFRNLKNLVIEKKIDKLIIGLPIKNGIENDFCKEIRKFTDDFVKFIKSEMDINLEVNFVDEVMTSKIGGEFIIQKRGKNKRIKKYDNNDDNLAAWVMLRERLD